MESTAFNWYQFHNAVGTPMHSIGIHCSMQHGFHCIQPGYTAPGCMQSTAFTRDAFHNAAWNRLHSIIPHGIQCIQSGSIGPCCMEATDSIEIQCTTLHRIHCIQSCFMESTPFNRDPLGHTAWNPLHSLGIHFTTLHGIHSIDS